MRCIALISNWYSLLSFSLSFSLYSKLDCWLYNSGTYLFAFCLGVLLMSFNPSAALGVDYLSLILKSLCIIIPLSLIISSSLSFNNSFNLRFISICFLSSESPRVSFLIKGGSLVSSSFRPEKGCFLRWLIRWRSGLSRGLTALSRAKVS